VYEDEDHAFEFLSRAFEEMVKQLGLEKAEAITKKAARAWYPYTSMAAKRGSKLEEVYNKISAEDIKVAIVQYGRRQDKELRTAMNLLTKPTTGASCINLIKTTVELGQIQDSIGFLVYIAYYYTGAFFKNLNKKDKGDIRKELEWSTTKFNKYHRRCKRVFDLVEKLGAGSLALGMYINSTDLEEFKDSIWKEFITKINNNMALCQLFNNITLNDYPLYLNLNLSTLYYSTLLLNRIEVSIWCCTMCGYLRVCIKYSRVIRLFFF
jgi:archaellin